MLECTQASKPQPSPAGAGFERRSEEVENGRYESTRCARAVNRKYCIEQYFADCTSAVPTGQLNKDEPEVCPPGNFRAQARWLLKREVEFRLLPVVSENAEITFLLRSRLHCILLMDFS